MEWDDGDDSSPSTAADCGGCEIESDDHVIVCVEAGENVPEDEVEAEAAFEADEGFEAEEDKDDPPSPSPCQVLDSHFDALTALANEGRTKKKPNIFFVTMLQQFSRDGVLNSVHFTLF